MPISPRPSTLRVDLLKITGYLLNLDSEGGRTKAKYFLSYGFDVSKPERFAEELFRHAKRCLEENRTTDQYGTLITYRGQLDCPNGVTGSDVRTVWHIAAGEREARLVTAYPV